FSLTLCDTHISGRPYLTSTARHLTPTGTLLDVDGQGAAVAAARAVGVGAGRLEVGAQVLRQREGDVLRRRADLLDLAVAELTEPGDDVADAALGHRGRSEEHTSELL